ncbi:MAG: hypothetical protein ACRDZ8_15940 [Acidimicrobiales bacterium]
MTRAGGRWRRSRVAGALFSIMVLGLTGCGHSSPFATGSPCHAAVGNATYGLDTDQAANATTIAAVGVGLGLPDHAVTIALAAALQESKLVNLPYGDLDSLGLFQQRPSQGWGTPAQILTPRYAATVFYQHLELVAGWQTLPVTDAAQDVQNSGVPDAYSKWESEARGLAQALTGELPAAFACHIPAKPKNPAPTSVIADGVSGDLGAPAIGVALPAARGWQVAGWLIGHAAQYGVTAVTVNGQRWSAHSGQWSDFPPVSNVVAVTV